MFKNINIIIMGLLLVSGHSLFGLEVSVESAEDSSRIITAATDLSLDATRVAERFTGIVDLQNIAPDLLFTAFISEKTATELKQEAPQSIVELFDRAGAGQLPTGNQSRLYLLLLFDFPPPVTNRWIILNISRESEGSDFLVHFDKFAGDLDRCTGGIRLTPTATGQSHLAISLALIADESSRTKIESFLLETFIPNVNEGLTSWLSSPLK